MTDKPIIFSGPMVRAILEGRKTQTRRVVKLANSALDGMILNPHSRFFGRRADAFFGGLDFSAAWPDKGPSPAGNPGPYLHAPYPPEQTVHRVYPRWTPGDLLWVREKWAHVPIAAYRRSVGVQQTPDPTDSDMVAVYAAGWDRSPPSRWRPSIHMPRWASRLTLRVTGVRVERVQDISDEDAKAEGTTLIPIPGHRYADYRVAFADLWDSLNEKRGCGWLTNPWVWVVRFEPIRENVDEVLHD